MAMPTDPRSRRRRWRWALLVTAGALPGLWLAYAVKSQSGNGRTPHIAEVATATRLGAGAEAGSDGRLDVGPDTGAAANSATSALPTPATTADPGVEAESAALQRAVADEMLNDH
jgi:hypothetical protein